MPETINSEKTVLEDIVMPTKCEHFISEIHINKIRHLHDIEIPLSTSERKHLIFTGKNGSGKTSVLNELAEKLDSVWRHQRASTGKYYGTGIFETLSSGSILSVNLIEFHNRLHYTNYTEFVDCNTMVANIEDRMQYLLDRGHFILCHFSAQRKYEPSKPEGPNDFQPYKVVPFISANHSTYNLNTNFIQYMVNLESQLGIALLQERKHVAQNSNNFNSATNSDIGNTDIDYKIQQVGQWFTMFTDFLRRIYDDPELSMELNSTTWQYDICTKDPYTKNIKKFTFNELSDGYGSVLYIVTEIILRMEQNKSNISTYDVEGIVLIDEIESHLHVSLQKEVMRLLTEMFPRIQFIVTTHSPFVLTSIDNAVIYDLEKQTLVEDLSQYSYETIVESYFEIQKESDIKLHDMQRYGELKSSQDSLTEEEEKELVRLYQHLFPKSLAKLQLLQLKYGLNEIWG